MHNTDKIMFSEIQKEYTLVGVGLVAADVEKGHHDRSRQFIHH